MLFIFLLSEIKTMIYQDLVIKANKFTFLLSEIKTHG